MPVSTRSASRKGTNSQANTTTTAAAAATITTAAESESRESELSDVIEEDDEGEQNEEAEEEDENNAAARGPYMQGLSGRSKGVVRRAYEMRMEELQRQNNWPRKRRLELPDWAAFIRNLGISKLKTYTTTCDRCLCRGEHCAHNGQPCHICVKKGVVCTVTDRNSGQTFVVGRDPFTTRVPPWMANRATQQQQTQQQIEIENVAGPQPQAQAQAPAEAEAALAQNLQPADINALTQQVAHLTQQINILLNQNWQMQQSIFQLTAQVQQLQGGTNAAVPAPVANLYPVQRQQQQQQQQPSGNNHDAQAPVRNELGPIFEDIMEWSPPNNK